MYFGYGTIIAHSSRLFVIAFLLMGSSGLLGCLPRFTQDDLKQHPRVAVISLAKETLRGVDQGTTAFQHYEFSGDLRPWLLNQYAEQTIGEVLKNCSRVEVVATPANAIALFSKYQISEVTLINSSGAFGNIRDEILHLGKTHGLDLIVLVLDYTYTTYARHQELDGFTLSRSTFLGAGGINLYVIQELRVLDLHRQRAVNRLPFLGKITDDQMSMSLWVDPEKIQWKDSFEGYSHEEKQYLVSVIKRKIRTQAIEALDDMGLITANHSSCIVPQ